MKIRISLLLSAVVFLSGCGSIYSRDTTFTMAARKDFSIDNRSLELVKAGAVGKDEAVFFLLLPLGFPNMDAALDKALADGGGEVIMNYSSSTYVKGIFFPTILFYGIRIEGDVYRVVGENMAAPATDGAK